MEWVIKPSPAFPSNFSFFSALLYSFLLQVIGAAGSLITNLLAITTCASSAPVHSISHFLYLFSFPSVFFCHHYLHLTPSAVVLLVLSSLSLHLSSVTFAVEIKVIKDLPWPPPVGQLNTSPPPSEELESPTQTAQPSPGQTSCDQHHHGGCWCSHCQLSSPLIAPSLQSQVHPSMYPSFPFLTIHLFLSY